MSNKMISMPWNSSTKVSPTRKRDISPNRKSRSQSKENSQMQRNNSTNGFGRDTITQALQKTPSKLDIRFEKFLQQDTFCNDNIASIEREEDNLKREYSTNPLPVPNRGDILQEKTNTGSKYSLTDKKYSGMKNENTKTPTKQNAVNRSFTIQRSSNQGNRSPSPNTSLYQNLKKTYGRKNPNLKIDEDAGKGVFILSSQDFMAGLQQMSVKLETNIKKDFEKTAHNILFQYIQKDSLFEKDETSTDVESKNQILTKDHELSFSHQVGHHSTELAKEKISGQDKYESSSKMYQTPTKQARSNSMMLNENRTASFKGTNEVKEMKVSGPYPSVQGLFKNQRLINEEILREETSLHFTEKENLSRDEGINVSHVRPKGQTMSLMERTISVVNLGCGNKSMCENKDDELYDEGIIHARVTTVHDLEVEQKLSKLKEIALQLIKEYRYEEAIKYLLRAKELIRNELGDNSPQQIYIYYLLGECFIKRSDFPRAEQTLKEAIKRYEENEATYRKDNRCTCYYLGLMMLQSHICMETRRFDRALIAYEKLIEELENKDQDKERLKGIIPHILLIKYNVGGCLRRLNRLEEADIVFYEVAKKFNFEDEELLENYCLLINIAEHFVNRQQTDSALEVFKKLSEIRSSNSHIEKTKPEMFSLIYDEIAAILYNKKKYTESIKYYELSVKLKIDYLGRNHLKVGYSLLALGKAYYMATEYEKALNRFSSGLDILECIEGNDTVYSANITLTMAKIHFTLKEYDRAIFFYERGVEIYSRLYGHGHPYCLRIYANLVFVCFECNNKQKTLDVTEKLVKAIKEANDPEVFETLNEIGNIYRKNSFYEEALEFYTTALRKFCHVEKSKISGKQTNLVYINMGNSYFHLQKYEIALKYYKEAVHYFAELNGGSNAHIVSIYINIVRLYKVLGRNVEAATYLKKATNTLSFLEKESINKKNIESVSKLKNDLKNLIIN